jgi:hypothetical protein
MVTPGGLDMSGLWTAIYYDVDAITHYWRKGVIRLLRASLRTGLLRPSLAPEQIEPILAEHGRYARRPPIAQRRITYIGRTVIRFWVNDKKLRRRKVYQFSTEEFLRAWMQHIPDRYEHAVRSFGLFSPRMTSNSSAVVLDIFRQRPRRRPKPLSWSYSIKRDFGWDPLLDRSGNHMRWTRRIAPKAQLNP